MSEHFLKFFWKSGQPTVILTATIAAISYLSGTVVTSFFDSRNDLISQERAAVVETMLNDIDGFKSLSSELELLAQAYLQELNGDKGNLKDTKNRLRQNIAKQLPIVVSLSPYIEDERLLPRYEKSLANLFDQVELDLPPESQKPLWQALRDTVYYRNLILKADRKDIKSLI